MDKETISYIIRFYGRLLPTREKLENKRRISHGGDSFDNVNRELVEKILQEHSSEIHFNNCSKCGKLARTSQAKQCCHCYYDWH